MIRLCKSCGIPDEIILGNEIFVCDDVNSPEFSSKEIISINRDGFCNACIEYERVFNKEHLEKEVQAFSKTKPNKGAEFDTLVAYSGGKDSTVALYLASKILNLKVIAYTLDNGFIPEKVLERSERICNFLNIPLIVVKDTIYQSFFEYYGYDQNIKKWFARENKDLCSFCSKKIFSNLELILDKYSIKKVITGVNTYSRMSSRRVSSVAKTWYHSNKGLKYYWQLALPYAMQIDIFDQKRILKELPWQDISLKGYTSNCLIPGFTEGFCNNSKNKFNFDIAYLAKEKRSGYFRNCSEAEFQELLNPKMITEKDHEYMTKFFHSKGFL